MDDDYDHVVSKPQCWCTSLLIYNIYYEIESLSLGCENITLKNFKIIDRVLHHHSNKIKSY